MDGVWIRSQDRESLMLLKTLSTMNSVKGVKIINPYADGYDILGEYITKERALQVLDEIQQAITNYANTLEYNKTQANSGQCDAIWPVYEMPAE